MASLRFISVCTYIPATHTAHQAVWFGLLSPEGGGQRGGVREHPRATGGRLGCSAVEGYNTDCVGVRGGCVDVRSGCVDVRSGCAHGMENLAFLVAYYKSDSHSTLSCSKHPTVQLYFASTCKLNQHCTSLACTTSSLAVLHCMWVACHTTLCDPSTSFILGRSWRIH